MYFYSRWFDGIDRNKRYCDIDQVVIGHDVRENVQNPCSLFVSLDEFDYSVLKDNLCLGYAYILEESGVDVTANLWMKRFFVVIEKNEIPYRSLDRFNASLLSHVLANRMWQ